MPWLSQKVDNSDQESWFPRTLDIRLNPSDEYTPGIECILQREIIFSHNIYFIIKMNQIEQFKSSWSLSNLALQGRELPGGSGESVLIICVDWES